MFRSIFLVVSMILLSACGVQFGTLIPKPQPKELVQDKVGNVNFVVNYPVDILFVIDDSGSMNVHQTTLAQNSSVFARTIAKNKILNTHYGVVTSSMSTFPCSDRMGRLFGNPRYITKTTPDYDLRLIHNLQPGDRCSGIERFFDAIYTAVTPPLSVGYNSGFLRKDAHLAIIFITDTYDQSRMVTGDQLYEHLVRMKGGDRNKILAYGAIIPPAVQRCRRDEQNREPTAIMKFIKRAGGSYFNLCAANYGARLARVGEEIVSQIELFIPLSDIPADGTIRINMGAYVLPNDPVHGWSYDPMRNGVLISQQVKIPAKYENESLEINYLPAEFGE